MSLAEKEKHRSVKQKRDPRNRSTQYAQVISDKVQKHLNGGMIPIQQMQVDNHWVK